MIGEIVLKAEDQWRILRPHLGNGHLQARSHTFRLSMNALVAIEMLGPLAIRSLCARATCYLRA
jgi:hypothetical protein